MTLRFSVALAAVVASFAATGCFGGSDEPRSLPTTLSALVTPELTALAGTAVTPVPAVRVTNQSGQAVKGIPVTFVVTGGGVIDASTTTTDANGAASPGAWTLGATAGLNTLTASVANITPVLFTVTATAPDLCSANYGTLLIGTSITGSLTAADCQLSTGEYTDFYTLTVPAAQALLITQTSATLDSYLSLFTSSAQSVADDDDADTTTFNSSFKVLVNPGSFTVGVSTSGPNSTGPYTLSATSTSSSNDNCDLVFLMRGVTTNQTISASDCDDTTGPYYEDFFLVYLDAGVPVIINETSTALDAYLELYLPSGDLVVSNNNRDATTTDARISYTPTVSGYFFVGAETNNVAATGGYTLSVTPVGAALAGVRTNAGPLLARTDQRRLTGAKNWRTRLRAILSAPATAHRRGPKLPGPG